MSSEGPQGEGAPSTLPHRVIERLTAPLDRFLHIESAGGVVLLVFSVIALVFANSGAADAFLNLWNTPLGLELGDYRMVHSLKHWINDGLMALFFFVVGLEVKRELAIGELREVRRAALPIAAAIGGMLVPAGLYVALLAGRPGVEGWGIPMATDIAFVVGCMAVLGSRMPHGLRVMLLSLAIADDIGAILVIAIGYTESIDMTALAWGVVGMGLIPLLARLGLRSLLVYTVLGLGIWLAFHESGVHATIAGVILGLLTPAKAWVSESRFSAALARTIDLMQGSGWTEAAQRAERARLQRAARETISPLEFLESLLHPWVAFVIMPLFALANAGVAFHLSDFGDPVAVAIGAGLVIGKPLGILAFAWLAVKLGGAALPEGVSWVAVLGAGALAGIGFTMSLFIADLSLGAEVLDAAKIGILGASALAAVLGLGLLVWSLPKAEAR